MPLRAPLGPDLDGAGARPCDLRVPYQLGFSGHRESACATPPSGQFFGPHPGFGQTSPLLVTYANEVDGLVKENPRWCAPHSRSKPNASLPLRRSWRSGILSRGQVPKLLWGRCSSWSRRHTYFASDVATVLSASRRTHSNLSNDTRRRCGGFCLNARV